jgi:uncharacterized membrane protein
MDQSPPFPTQPVPPAAPAATTESTARLVYILYLVSLVLGVTMLVGVVMAYVNRADAPVPLRTHYELQIRTFWMMIAYALVGFVLSFVMVGFLVWLFIPVWLVVRSVRGLRYLERREPYPNPSTWLW